MRDNKGFTLVELMLVIALMAILVGVSVLTVNLVGNTNVSKTANQLDVALQKSKMMCMSKGSDSGGIRIFSDDKSVYYTIGNGEPVVLAKNGYIQVYYQMESDSDVLINNSSNEITLKYNSSSGALLDIGSDKIDRISIVRGDKRYDIEFYTATGKHKLLIV